MSKAYFTLGNSYCLARGKKDALTVSRPGASGSQKLGDGPVTAVNLAAGADRLEGGKKVFVTLTSGSQTFVLDPSKLGKSGELSWSKSLSLSGSQYFKLNVLDGRPFSVGSFFGLSYKNNDTKLTRYLCFGQGAEPLPILSESSDNIIRLVVTEIATEEESDSEDSSKEATQKSSCSPDGGAADSSPPKPSVGFVGDSPVAQVRNEAQDNRRYVVDFLDGPLGVKLKRSRHGVLLVQDIISSSQAQGRGIGIGDKLCCIGKYDVGDHPIEDDEFNSIIGVIKDHPRPLPITFERLNVSVPTRSDTSDPDVPLAAAAETSGTDHSGLSVDAHGSVQSQDASVAPAPTQQDIDDLNALKKLSERLVIAPAASRSSVAGGIAGIAAAIGKPKAMSSQETFENYGFGKTGFNLVSEGRRIIKHGELDTLGRGTLWNVKTSKYVFLLSDVILITTVKGRMFHLESVINYNVCKLDSSPKDQQTGSNCGDTRFDLRWPGGVVEIVCKDVIEKNAWVRALSDAICHHVFTRKGALTFGWRHLYVHGTIHSAVLARDEVTVQSIISACEGGSLDMGLLDQKDEDGYTPLHLACIIRATAIADMLLSSHIDCTVPDSRGMTAFHWCAAQLDVVTLEVLCSRVFDVDILDEKGRTPLYVACVEGRDANGKTDVDELCKIIVVLTDRGASPNVVDKAGLSPLHYVSASLQYEAVGALLRAGAIVNGANDSCSALHFACRATPLKFAKGEGELLLRSDSSSDEDGNIHNPLESIFISDIGRTIGRLLEHGIWPNARNKERMTPLLLLVNAEGLGDPLFEIAATLLVTSGARLEDSYPESNRNERYLDLRGMLLKSQDEWMRRAAIDASPLALCPGAFLPSATQPTRMSVAQDQCRPCSATFSLIKRRHRCRLCDVTCCDDCSRKRVIIESGKEALRVCDGCFNRAFSEVESFKSSKFLSEIKPIEIKANFSKPSDAENRQTLFTSSKEKSGETLPQDKIVQQQGSAAAAVSVLSEARQNLEQRGERLTQLSEKSEKLASASNEFANMAKQLRKQQQQKNTWW